MSKAVAPIKSRTERMCRTHACRPERPQSARGKPKLLAHKKMGLIVIAITASAPQSRHLPIMDGERGNSRYPCPSCSRPMGLTRTIPGSPGLSEMQTYGCKDCWVWVTEASDATNPRDWHFRVR